MNLVARIKSHFRTVAVDTAYFATWIGTLVLLKTLVLKEHGIGFSGWSKVLAGALILGRVARILGHVPAGKWIRSLPAWMAVVLRTALFSIGLATLLLVTGALETRDRHGGLVAALKAMQQEASYPLILTNAICLTGAFLIYNALAVIRVHLGGGSLFLLFLQPLPEKTGAHLSESDHTCSQATPFPDDSPRMNATTKHKP